MRTVTEQPTGLCAHVPAIRAAHQKEFKARVLRLVETPRLELIRYALEEQDAKNRAYYFILEMGLFEAFHAYCTGQPLPGKEVCHA